MLLGKNYPVAEAEKAGYVWLELPKKGGHVGFTLPGDEFSWMEYRAEEFLEGLGL